MPLAALAHLNSDLRLHERADSVGSRFRSIPQRLPLAPTSVGRCVVRLWLVHRPSVAGHPTPEGKPKDPQRLIIRAIDNL
jgi:hypothetical protein